MSSKEPNGFSILCVFNDQEKLHNYLVQSLERQKAPYELIAIDNRNNAFKCAARVLNAAAAKAKYDHLMFVHQDVALGSDTWLLDARNAIAHLDDFGAAGAAGKSGQGLVANVLYGIPPKKLECAPIQAPVPVQTLDGCLLIVPKEIFLAIGFDEQTCPGWYLYVADYCLDVARLGRKVYVLPHAIYHESIGLANRRVYQEARRNIINKHQSHVSAIYMTVGDWKSRPKIPETIPR
ncbi:MAG: family 2 glycosyl transferase [Desulfobacterales bacterium]|nr:family 2 glycosyl transferase [Desulfobacterales bacterium]